MMVELESNDQHQAYSALRAVLHAVRDRITVDEAAHLGAQLPLLIRGIYCEGWHPAATPRKERHCQQFSPMFMSSPPVRTRRRRRGQSSPWSPDTSAPARSMTSSACFPRACASLWPERSGRARAPKTHETGDKVP
jgi:hypothetical protein